MAQADAGVIDDFLNAFRTQVDTGFGLISGDVHAVFASLVVISVSVTLLFAVLDERQSVTAAFLRKVMSVGFFSWLLESWPSLSALVVNGFASLGLKAGSSRMSLSDLVAAPSKVVGEGFGDAFALVAYIGSLAQQGYGTGFFAHFDVILVAALSAIGLILAFVVLAVEIAVTVIEFHIVSLIAFVILPFGVLSQTAFMSDKAIGFVVSIGVKMMTLALVVSIGESVFATYTVSAQPTATEECGLLLAAALMLGLAMKAPGIAAGLISGGPTLTAGAALGGAAGAAGAVSAATIAIAGRGLLSAPAGGYGLPPIEAAFKAASAASRPAPAAAASQAAGAAPAANAPSEDAHDA